MSEEPETPPPLPTIPRGALWTSLMVPPLVTLVANAMIGLFSKIGGNAVFSLCVPPVVFFVILGLLFQFHKAVSQRYQGRSRVFLDLGYFFGQIIVCIALWFGTCALLFPPLNLR